MGQISSNVKAIYLLPWFEVIGIFTGLFTDNYYIYLKIDNKVLSFPKDSDEAIYLKEKLDTVLVGRKIAILQTDIHKKHLLVHLFDCSKIEVQSITNPIHLRKGENE